VLTTFPDPVAAPTRPEEIMETHLMH
jgi:hypothetical protein